MKSLILAEKPSVAKEIARVLGCTQKQKHYIEGPNYVVTWALGHLVTLAEPEDYDTKFKAWELEHLPLLPDKMKLKVIKETTPQFRAIAQLAKRSDLKQLIIATDAGREGELVARWIMEEINWRKPFQRLWISSQTDKAIIEGFAKLKPGKDYDSLYQAAVCRAEADWLIGLNMTRALTCKYNAQLAAGRVQTPTLSMMMERENEIRAFQSKDYWLLHAHLSGFQAMWRSKEHPDGRLFDKVQADILLNKMKSEKAKVTHLRMVEKSEPHPLAYDLTELQRDANRKYGFTAKQTSNLLQRLYEQYKIVTYPRTDSRYLTSDMIPTLKSRLDSICVQTYSALVRPLLNKPLPVTKRIADDSKVSDHHAIIPTEQTPLLHILSHDERRLYDLIARRFIALFYPAYRYDETSVTVEITGESFYAKGRVTKDAGWKAVYGHDASGSLISSGSGEEDDLGDTDAGSSQNLPKLQMGDELKDARPSLDKHMTKPPSRYTEATLLSVMEQHKLGTPATRADIIEKLLSTDTIERKTNVLQPTGKGAQLIELVVPSLRSPELTAKWELELENIAKGSGNMKAFLQGIREQTTEMVRTVKQSTTEYKPHNLTHSKCPDCSKNLQEIKSKRGKMLVCMDRECGYKRAAEPMLSNKRCLQCHKKMEIHTGKAGKYAQCRHCNIIEMLGDEPRAGGKAAKRNSAQLINQFSDKATGGSSLEEALKAAMQKKTEPKQT
ncbi:DNA topoisomerase III [Paenibacillus agricola]|uniref:DNA topoisomerase n=1 Tax=Paenibacillus agricola TaxID=2716264 RepID=A0ABX0JA97_9BACL|nr:DNA topoisomerase III [Paenibacillus agricola]NHN30675.1 DNA topoisomerase III [Paenibacillus agricola]